MHSFPPVPDLASDRSVLEGGHLWLLEDIDGGVVRFRLRDDGRVEFGDRDHAFGDPVPTEYAATVRHVRETLDRAALRSAVDDVEAVTFFGVATYRRRIDYDWNSLPPFLGTEVHDGDRFLSPDAAEGVFERLGLDPVPALEKEVRAADFDPGRFSVPDSAFYDGPALGVILRTKTGERARMPGPGVEGDPDPDPLEGDAESVASELVTAAHVDAVRRRLEEEHKAEFETVFERVLERVYRVEAPRITDRETDLDRRAFRSAVARAVREYLGRGDRER